MVYGGARYAMRASGMSQFQRETLPRATSRSSGIKRERCIETTLPLSPLQSDFTIRRAAPRSHCLLALNRFPLSLSDDPLSMHPPDNRSFCHRSITEPLPGGGQRPRAPLGFVSRGYTASFCQLILTLYQLRRRGGDHVKQLSVPGRSLSTFRYYRSRPPSRTVALMRGTYIRGRSM
jgi:hypothetical protein